MTDITFYAKPDCSTNLKQRALLQSSGHNVCMINILKVQWTESKLMAFFKYYPVREWFNVNAPQIKSGEIDPAEVLPRYALGLMSKTPLLIRRPLLVINGMHMVGFDTDLLRQTITLTAALDGQAWSCSQSTGEMQ